MDKTIQRKIFQNTTIPSDWEVKKLIELGIFLKGKGISKVELTEKGKNAIRYGELYTVHNFFIKEFYSFIPEELAGKSTKLENGDILFAGSGETAEEIGKSAAYISNEDAYAGGDIIILRTNKNEIDTKFLGFQTNHDVFRRQTFKMAQGNAVVHIYPGNLSKIKLPIPPLPEQKAIAQVLSTWDHAIQKTEALLAQKELRKKWLMQQLLTGKKRLKGFSGEWRERRIEDEFEFIKSYSHSRANLTYKKPEFPIFNIHYGDIHTIFSTAILDLEIQKNIPVLKPAFEKEISYITLVDGDIIIADASEDYEGVGECVEIINVFDKHIIAGLHTIVLRSRRNKMAKGFGGYFFNGEYVRNSVRRIATGISVYGISKTNLALIKIKLPEFKEQTAIANILQTADKEIELIKAKAAQLREQKKGLMQVLLTGKKRLKVNDK